jgi:hypothetical protein
MKYGALTSIGDNGRGTASDLFRCMVWLLWQCIRLPLFLLLVTLEPVANLVLGSLALLGVLSAFFSKLVGPPGVPFFLMLTIALSFQFALLVYHALLHLLSR